jgi:hypothetical protein
MTAVVGLISHKVWEGAGAGRVLGWHRIQPEEEEFTEIASAPLVATAVTVSG